MGYRFKISGSLPAPWEDFVYMNAVRPPGLYLNIVTIYADETDHGPKTGQEMFIDLDGYVDLYIPDKKVVTEVRAKELLGIVLGCRPDEITIESDKFCQSV